MTHQIADSAQTLSVRFFAQSMANSAFNMWSGWTVMNAGDQLHIYTADHPLDYWVAGATLPFIPGF